VEDKVATVLRHALPEDLADSHSRKRFLEGLPPWVFGTVGGNTACVSVDIDGFDEPLVFDCGSGMRELGSSVGGAPPNRYHVLLSHFHWDHLQGFPFFVPAYNRLVNIDFYSPRAGFEGDLSGLMKMPYSPIQLEDMPAKKKFHLLEAPISIGPAEISFKHLNHPGDAYAFKISHVGRRFIYATDVELTMQDFMRDDENASFFEDADVALVDSQYTLMEAIEKFKWGHSSYSMAVEFAMTWKIKHLVLFHHDPRSDDKKLYEMLQSARRYLKLLSAGSGLKITLAREGMEIIL